MGTRALKAGEKLGSYEIVSLLGEGGMGEVYKANDTRLDREVALKVLPEEFFEDKKWQARFEREAKALAALNHPNIAAVFSFEEISGRHLLVMELLEGETLRSALAGAKLSTRKAIDVARQIAQGLAAAHEKGIVHRDLKPENVFVTEDGRAKILDFGLAKPMRETTAEGLTQAETAAALTEAGTVVGTVSYMSPEQAMGRAVDFRSDQFSFGSLLYEMATGGRAFRKETMPETLSAIIREEPRPIASMNPEIPAPLRWIVERCLAKEPRERYASTEDLARDLALLQGRLQEAAMPAEAPSAALPAQSRFRTVLASLLAAGALAVGALAGRQLWKTPAVPLPGFHRLTFRLGSPGPARFSPDGQTVLYGAAWEGRPVEIFSTRPDNPESRPLDFGTATVLSVSASGELAIVLRPRVAMGPAWIGTLARVPIAGGAPREILDDVIEADWAPDGKSLAVVRSVGGKRRVEFPIGKVLYETAGWIPQIRVSREGDRVAFNEWLGYEGSVAVVDMTGKREVLEERVFVPWGIAWSPRGDEIWYASIKEGDSGEVTAVSLSGKRRIVARIPGGVGLMDVARDGRALLWRYTWRTSINSFSTGANAERSLSWLDESTAADLSADGKTLLFTESGRGTWPGTAVYVRKTDGSPPVRLGEGIAMALSPDGKWALTVAQSPSRLVLLPVGPGEPRQLLNEGIASYEQAAFLASGSRILFSGTGKSGETRCWVQEIDGGPPRAVSPEGTSLLPRTHTVSPDGRFYLAAGPDRMISSYPVDGGEPTHIASLAPSDIPVRWSADGRSIFVYRFGDLPARIDRLNVATGTREPWKTIMPSDPGGIVDVRSMQLTPDGKSYAYSFSRMMADLYLVEGLR